MTDILDEFRRTDITVGTESFTLQAKSIEEVFKFGTQAYVVLGASECGKTTICIDIISKYSSIATSIYYVTKTRSDYNDPLMKIPNIYKRAPTYEDLNGIWSDIKSIEDAHGATGSELRALYMKMPVNDTQPDPRTALRILDSKIKELSSDDEDKTNAVAFEIEILTRLILDRLESIGPVKAKTYLRSLSAKEMFIINSLASETPKNIVIIDDVTAALVELRNVNSDVIRNGCSMRKHKAFKTLLTEIFTTSRHFKNTIICLFLHTLDPIEDVVKTVVNYAFLSQGAVDEFNRKKTAGSSNIKPILSAASSYLFSKPEYKYYMLYVNVENINKMAVCRATLYTDTRMIELSPMNKYFIKTVESIIEGTQRVDTEDSDDVGALDEMYFI